MNDCIFCKILAGEIPSVRVYEGPNCVAFLDVNPMAKGHVLVVPRRHWADLASVPVAEAGDVAAFSELVHAVRAIAKAAIRADWDGANVLQCTGESAGQTVGHQFDRRARAAETGRELGAEGNELDARIVRKPPHGFARLGVALPPARHAEQACADAEALHGAASSLGSAGTRHSTVRPVAGWRKVSDQARRK